MDQMLQKLQEAVAKVEAAEKLAPAGSHQQSEYVKAALYSAWPVIKAYAKHVDLMPVYGSKPADD